MADYAADTSDTGVETTEAGRWIREIECYERTARTWTERASKITKIYLDEHRNERSKRRFALLWSNIETLKPAVYARQPIAVVSRRYKDADPAGRKASEVLERAINTTFDLGGFDEVMRAVRDDRLLAARGQAWVRYEADIENEGDDQRLAGERVVIDHVHWSDFGHTVDRTWREVRAVWRKVYLTKAKIKERFGDDVAKRLNYTMKPDYGKESRDAEPQTCIYEIWSRIDRKVIWLAKDEKLVLEASAPPLDFRRGFPCPEPCYGTKATKSLIPVPDYRYYQDQAEEIDDLTEKIANLVSWLRLRGLIPGGASSEGGDAVKQALSLEGDQVFVTVESWTGFAEKGGAKGLVEWLPLDMVVTALREAVQARAQLINDVYQITGISDILRGDTDPDETLGAQELKAQTGTRRLSNTQQELARFARDIAELAGEVIAEQFRPETLSEMTGIDMTPEPPPEMLAQLQVLGSRLQAPPVMAPPSVPAAQPDPQVAQLQQQMQQFELNKQALQILRDDRTRGFRIEIETDSTIQPDEQREKQARVEFLTATGGFMQQALPVLQAAPFMAPVVGEMLMFMVRGFRAGRSMEDVIEQSMARLQQQAMQPPPPDPRIEAEKAKLEAEARARAEEHQQKMQQSDQQHQQNMEFEREKHANSMAASQEAHRQTMAVKRREGMATEIGDAESAEPGMLAGVLDEQRSQSAQIGQTLAQMMAMIAEMGNRPKRVTVIRGRDGKVAGAEVTH